jgi:hypothetical protein
MRLRMIAFAAATSAAIGLFGVSAASARPWVSKTDPAHHFKLQQRDWSPRVSVFSNDHVRAHYHLGAEVVIFPLPG